MREKLAYGVALYLALSFGVSAAWAVEVPKQTVQKQDWTKSDYVDGIRDRISDEQEKHKELTKDRTKYPNFSFHINKDGSMADLKVVESSGDTAFDETALSWVKATAPYAPPPEGVSEFSWNFKPLDLDFGGYMANAQRVIKRNWHPPKGDTSREVIVQFVVARDGETSKIQLARSTGTKEGDDAAIAAVKLASPLAHLPAGAPKSVHIQFTFDYNVYKGRAKLRAVDPKAKLSNAYIEALESAIEKAAKWDLTKASSAEFAFSVKPDGTATPPQLTKTSGDASFDASLVTAIKSCFPTKVKSGAPAAVPVICALDMLPLPKQSQDLPPALTGDAKVDAPVLNNEGVRAMSRGDFRKSIDYLEQALKLNPDYKTARENLGIAYNNYGLKQPPGPAEAMFCRALFIHYDNKTTKGNLREVLKANGKQCASSEDFLNLAKSSQAHGDFVGAYVHSRLAQDSQDNIEAKNLAEQMLPLANKQVLGTAVGAK